MPRRRFCGRATIARHIRSWRRSATASLHLESCFGFLKRDESLRVGDMPQNRYTRLQPGKGQRSAKPNAGAYQTLVTVPKLGVHCLAPEYATGRPHSAAQTWQLGTLAAPLCIRMRNNVDRPSPPLTAISNMYVQMAVCCQEGHSTRETSWQGGFIQQPSPHLINFIDMHLSVCPSRGRRRGNTVGVQGCCDRIQNLADWLGNVVSQIAHSVLEGVAQVLHGFHHLGCACGLRLYHWLYRWIPSGLFSLHTIFFLWFCVEQVIPQKLRQAWSEPPTPRRLL